MKVLALIPARGGSKGIPKKNIVDLNGKPLIAYTIEAAKNVPGIDQIVVSSDSDEILFIAEQFGATPLKRPTELATDESSSNDPISHAIENNPEVDTILLLQPTSPLRNATHINEALEKFSSSNSECLISVKELKHSPYLAYKIEEEKLESYFDSNPYLDKRRQDIPAAYAPNGAIYIFSVKAFKESSGIPREKVLGYLMDETSSLDIDSETDLKIVRVIQKDNE